MNIKDIPNMKDEEIEAYLKEGEFHTQGCGHNYRAYAIGPFIVEQNAYYNVKAMKAEKRGDYDAAEMYIRKAIQIHPEGYSYHETLGKVLFHEGEFNESIAQFNFLLEKDKRLTDYYKAYYHLWIGKALLKLNRIEEAKKELKKVQDANIDDFKKELRVLLDT